MKLYSVTIKRRRISAVPGMEQVITFVTEVINALPLATALRYASMADGVIAEYSEDSGKGRSGRRVGVNSGPRVVKKTAKSAGGSVFDIGASINAELA